MAFWDRLWGARPAEPPAPLREAAPRFIPEKRPKVHVHTSPMADVPRESDEPYDPRPPVLKAISRANATRQRWMHAHEIALHVINWLREEDFCAYPYLAEDLDDSVKHFCEIFNIAQPHLQAVREQIACQVDDVHYGRCRLNRGNPMHVFLIQRLEARGRVEPRNGWRVSLYTVRPKSLAQDARPLPNLSKKKPAKPRTGAPSRPVFDQSDTADIRSTSPSDPADLNIGWETTPSRRVA